MGFQSHGTSLSLRPIGAEQQQRLTWNPNCWRTPLCRAVKALGLSQVVVWNFNFSSVLWEIMVEWVNCDGLQTNISAWFDTLGDNRARRFVERLARKKHFQLASRMRKCTGYFYILAMFLMLHKALCWCELAHDWHSELNGINKL